MDSETIKAHIEELKEQRQQHLQQAQLQQAAYEGAIQALMHLLEQEVEVAPGEEEPVLEEQLVTQFLRPNANNQVDNA